MQNRYSTNLKHRILMTGILLYVYRVGTTIPLPYIDQQQIIASIPGNSITEFVKMYSGESNTINFFSLGFIPYINASIIIDTLTTSVPYLEKLQSEEGIQGKNKIYFYKKLLTIFFAIIQSFTLVNSVKGQLYDTSFSVVCLVQLLLIVGSFLVVWIINFLDGIGGLVNNGTSLIILVNVMVSLFRNLNMKFVFQPIEPLSILISFFLIYLIFLINFSQTASYQMPIVSARQLDYLEKQAFDFEKKIHFLQNSTSISNDISIKLNQAGVFPLIFASILISYGSFLFSNKILQNIIYYFFIIFSNLLYTIVFWDPDKISTQLRKSSVVIVNKKPGEETTKYLRKIVIRTALKGGVLLCSILVGYDIVKVLTRSPLLAQFNISSVIVTIGILNEIRKNLQSFGIFQLYNKNKNKEKKI